MNFYLGSYANHQQKKSAKCRDCFCRYKPKKKSLNESAITKKSAPAQKTWDDAVSLWLEETSTKATHEEDKKKLEWLKPFLGTTVLTDITSQVITEIRSASAKVLTRNGLGRTQSTTNRYLALVRSILIKAKDEWEWLERVPKIKLFKEPPAFNQTASS